MIKGFSFVDDIHFLEHELRESWSGRAGGKGRGGEGRGEEGRAREGRGGEGRGGEGVIWLIAINQKPPSLPDEEGEVHHYLPYLDIQPSNIFRLTQAPNKPTIEGKVGVGMCRKESLRAFRRLG